MKAAPFSCANYALMGLNRRAGSDHLNIDFQ
jgi:hypothetical protein